MAETNQVLLQPEVKYVIVPPIMGIGFYAYSIPEAQKAALAYNQKTGGFTAAMPLLLHNFPHPRWYTANSEDLSGIAQYNMPQLNLKKGEAYVATVHGGKDGKVGVILTPDKTELALKLWEDTKKQTQRKGLNAVHAAVLDDIYEGKDVLSVLVNEGQTPDNRSIAVFSYDQLIAGETPKDFSAYVVVRSLALAKKTISGYETINRLTNIAELRKQGLSEEEIAAKETVTDSQVIVYAGGVAEGNNVIKSARKNFASGELGVRHPFDDLTNFNSEQAQGRVPFVGNNDNFGLIGSGNLSNIARLAGVAPEALALLQLRKAPQKADGNMPPLDTLVASLGKVISPVNEAEVRRILSAFYRK